MPPDSLITFAIKGWEVGGVGGGWCGGWVHQNANECEQGEGRGVTSIRTFTYKLLLIEYLFHKLLTIVTRFCVGFIKIHPSYLKCLF